MRGNISKWGLEKNKKTHHDYPNQRQRRSQQLEGVDYSSSSCSRTPGINAKHEEVVGGGDDSGVVRVPCSPDTERRTIDSEEHVPPRAEEDWREINGSAYSSQASNKFVSICHSFGDKAIGVPTGVAPAPARSQHI